MIPTNNESDRLCFSESAQVFSDLASAIPSKKWRISALGVWSVRDLVGHTSRALSTIESYLGKVSGPPLNGPVEYFLAARAASVASEEIARRGIEAGAALGDYPATKVQELAHRIVKLVEISEDTCPVGTPWGTITLAGYLPTRTFELTIHGIDLAAAIGVPVPDRLGPSVSKACELAGALAGKHPMAIEILSALTGRSQLRNGITVL